MKLNRCSKQSAQALLFTTNKATYVPSEYSRVHLVLMTIDRAQFLRLEDFCFEVRRYRFAEPSQHKQSLTPTQTLKIVAMSAQSELYNGHHTNLPLLSLGQLQALHDYKERLIKADAPADLYLTAQQPALLFPTVSLKTNLDAAESTDAYWNPWNERDDEITRALCEDWTDSRARWERLYEQWSTAQGVAETRPGTRRSQSSNNLYLDPCLKDIDTAAFRNHNKQLLAMNALLHLQDQEVQSPQDTTSDDDVGIRAHVGQQQARFERSISPKSQLSVNQTQLGSYDGPALPYVGGPVKQPTGLTPEEQSPLDTCTQYSQSNLIPDEILEDHSAFKVNLPSISFLPQPSNGYDHPPIHFPSLSYVVEGIANGLDHKSHDSLPEHDTSQLRNISKLNI